MKKLIISLLLAGAVFTTKAQRFTPLSVVSDKDTVLAGQGIIYGLFIQRLGFSSGGFPQDIRLLNLDTKQIFTFRVKPTFKSSKENFFCYHIPAGHYAVQQYWYTQSKWYGGTMFEEHIFKGKAFSEIGPGLQAGQIREDSLGRYKFYISPHSLNYTGTWHFDQEIVSFTNDKMVLDKKLRQKYKRLLPDSAVANLPD